MSETSLRSMRDVLNLIGTVAVIMGAFSLRERVRVPEDMELFGAGAAVLGALAAGLIVARICRDRRRRVLSWTLPGLRDRLLRGTAVGGLAIAVLAGVAAGSLHGARAVLPVMGATSLAYSFGAAMFFRPVSPWTGWGNVGAGLAAFVAFVPLAQVWIAHPIQGTAVSLAVAGLLLRAAFRPEAHRWLIIGRSDDRRREAKERAWLARKWTRAAERRAARGLPLVDRLLGRWVRTVDAGGPVSRNDRAMLVVLSVYLIAMFAREVIEGRRDELSEIVSALSSFPLMLAVLPAAFGRFMGGAFLHEKVPYPLSRRDRARLVFAASLLATGRWLVVVAVVLAMLGVVVVVVVGSAGAAEYGRTCWLALGVTAIFVPLMQWTRLRLGLRPGEPGSTERALTAIAASLPFVTAVLVVYLPWSRSRGGLAIPLELGLLALGLVVSQWLYRRALAGYFRARDLV